MTKTVTLEPQEVEHLRYWHSEQARYNESKGWDATAGWHRARLASINSPAPEPAQHYHQNCETCTCSEPVEIRDPYRPKNTADV